MQPNPPSTTIRTSLMATMAASAITYSESAVAGNQIITEAVNNYSTCNGPSLATPISDAAGFRNEITISSPWHGGFSGTGGVWTDYGVLTTDFYDPQVSSYSDYDHVYFDHASLAFSYYAGHGAGGAGDTCWSSNRCFNVYQPCGSPANCTSPLPGSTYPAICRRDPGSSGPWAGSCSYTAYDRSMALGECWSGGRSGIVNYSNTAAKWGEAPGLAWAGAGTNGGTNVVVLSMSHPHRSGRQHELFPAFAGVQLVLSPLVHWGDSFIPTTRGYWFAKQAENPYASVANAFMAGMAALGTAGTACLGASGSTVYGGGYGVNGCGGAIALTLDSTATFAAQNIARNFINIQNDALKAYGAAYWQTLYSCNYDCNTWSMTL